jgi:hypothetical protein
LWLPIFGQDLKRADKPSKVEDLIDRLFSLSVHSLYQFATTSRTSLDQDCQARLTCPIREWLLNLDGASLWLAWQEPQIQHSYRSVFYMDGWMDGYVKPQLLLVSIAQKFEGLARNLTQKGTVGLAHVLHPTFQIFEFGRNLSS